MILGFSLVVMMKPLAAGLVVQLKQSWESSKVAESPRSGNRGVLTEQSPPRSNEARPRRAAEGRKGLCFDFSARIGW